MTRFKVVVPLLNKRTAPVEDTRDKRNVIGQVNDQFEFESVDEKTIGAVKWYKDREGCWYWGGGVKGKGIVFEKKLEAIPPLPFINYDETKMGWAFNKAFNGLDILSLWNDHKLYGQSVNVAVLDSGINTNISDITDAIVDKLADMKCFVPNESIEDDVGHGTNCSSLIAARGINLFGAAPRCNLIVAKIESKNFGKTPKVILEALKWACEERNADIISMSFSFPSLNDGPATPEDKLIADYISKMHTENNKFFVCSIGNLGENAKPFFAYPANYNGAVSIGAFGSDREAWKGSSWNKKLSFVAPGVQLKAYDLAGIKTALEPATSFACPFAAGILAGLISHFKTSNIPFVATDIIKNLAFDPPPKNEPLQYGRGVINVIQSLNNIKS